ncbi:MAG: YopX family protein [bacterium]
MRENKFRAWDNKTKQMLYDGGYWFPCDNKRDAHSGNCYAITVTSAGILYTKKLGYLKDDPYGYVDVHRDGKTVSYYANWEDTRLANADLELMQFIERRDIDGNKIHEDDIIEGNLFDDRIPTMGLVVYDAENTCYGSKNLAGITPLREINCIKIIGNRFDNPHLLEGEKDG